MAPHNICAYVAYSSHVNDVRVSCHTEFFYCTCPQTSKLHRLISLLRTFEPRRNQYENLPPYASVEDEGTSKESEKGLSKGKSKHKDKTKHGEKPPIDTQGSGLLTPFLVTLANRIAISCPRSRPIWNTYWFCDSGDLQAAIVSKQQVCNVSACLTTNLMRSNIRASGHVGGKSRNLVSPLGLP